MKISFIQRMSIATGNSLLLELQKKRMNSPTREKDEDAAFIFEPEEAFSYQHESDLSFIHDKDEFNAYCLSSSIPLVKTDRGGGIIWHGPGQIILAPVVDLWRLKINLSDYTKYLEETCLRTLDNFGISAFRNHFTNGSQGVWTFDPKTNIKKKIAFLGYYDSRGIAIHGCAINISPKLYPFSLIDPCNLPNVLATSVREVLGSSPDIYAVAKCMVEKFICILSEI